MKYPNNSSPFRRVLGDAFERLPASVGAMHDLAEDTDTDGIAEIDAAPGIGPWLVRLIAGLPKPGRNVPISVTIRPDGRGGEHWRRRFANRRYTSTMVAGEGGLAGFLVERFGLFRLGFELRLVDEGLRWSLKRWRWLRVPLPSWTAPSIECLESDADDCFVFDIKVSFPFVGRVVDYRGWLKVRAPSAD